MRLSIPTPATSAVEIGPLTIHFYALCIIAGVALAIWLGNLRFTHAHDEVDGVVADVAILAVPAGVIGGRIYHVLTSPQQYFGNGANFFDIFKIWNGGLGIWGAIALGTFGAYISYQRMSKERSLPPFSAFAGALAPGLALAQAIGRWGNWFNGELFGRPLDTSWALSIPAGLRPVGYEEFETFHPTFLYEAIWSSLLAAVLIKFGSRWATGSIFYIYIAGYSFARFFIEGLRIDPAHELFGLRINQWMSIFIIIVGVSLFMRNQRGQRERI